MTALQWLVLTLAVLIFTPMLLEFYRDWDYKRQVKGKRSPRRYVGKGFYGDAENLDVSEEMDCWKYTAWLKLKQNMLGPK